MKHKLTNFTDIEKEDIHEQYGEWNVPENHKWVKKEFNKAIKDSEKLFSPEVCILIEQKRKSYNFTNGLGDEMYIFQKVKDHCMHTSEYIESRIGEHIINDFNDETHQRILLEEIEKRFLTDFIEGRTDTENFSSFQEEIYHRQKLADCEMHTTPYVESRIWDYEINDLDDEIFKRIKLEECEK